MISNDGNDDDDDDFHEYVDDDVDDDDEEIVIDKQRSKLRYVERQEAKTQHINHLHHRLINNARRF